MHRSLLFIFTFLFIVNAWPDDLYWDLNDVSYLYQIPTGPTGDLDHLLSPQNIGTHGTLLPKAVFDRLPTLDNAGNGNETVYNQSLRVVSVRVDPCPRLEKPCQPEVRMVWQPLWRDRYSQQWTSRDAAAHSFYSLTQSDFEKLKERLWQLKIQNLQYDVNTQYLPLNVHPGLLNSQTKKEFNKSLNQIWLSFCGENNLKQLTFMSLLVPTRWWRFGSFSLADTTNPKWKRDLIPRLNGADFIDIFNTASESTESSQPKRGLEMDGMFNSLPEKYPESDNIFSLISQSYRFNDERDLPVFKTKLAAVDRFKNPNITHSKNLDCASCHFADASQFYAQKRFPELKSFSSVEAFTNPNPKRYNLANTTISISSTRVVRAFGYFETSPAINQRTIHDSAQSAEGMNTQ